MAELFVGLLEVLAEHQQHQMLVIVEDVVRVLRSSERVSFPLQYSLLSYHDAKQFMILCFLSILWQEAIPSPEQDVI